MSEINKILLASLYLGPVEYFARIFSADEVILEKEEHYIKQTYRNRCLIATANEVQSLTIPVVKVNGNRTKIKDVQITYAEKWQMVHWRAIVSAYSHSPYFLYYKDILEPFYFKKFKFLFDFNLQLQDEILNVLKIDKKISLTNSYELVPEDESIDLRNIFLPKIKSSKKFPPYIQVFSEKFEFLPNLSIIDLLFNEGPSAIDYLKTIKPAIEG